MNADAKVWTITDIKATNADAGWYFFSRNTMRFFRSKIFPTVYQGAGGVYFVTSEQPGPSAPREYRVREFNPATGSVVSVGGVFKIGLLARRAARDLSQGAP